MAGRIPQNFIDQLLDRVDIVDLIDSFVPLKKAGNNYKACCPFHGEKTPSFTVSREKQFYHCFGCGAHGTAISFLMEHDHQEFRDAVTTLAQQVGMEVPQDDQYQKSNTKPQGIDLYKLMADVTQFYEQTLKANPNATGAKEYLKQRGLTGAVAKRYQMGFAPDGWDTVLKQFGSDSKTQDALMQAGLLSKNEKGRIYDRFRNRIMFPIQDYRGRMVGFGGRVMDNSEPKYLNSPETPLFHKGSELYGLYIAKNEIRKHNTALVVEGYMDVIALAQFDINIAVASLGTALTPSQLERLFRYTPKIVICFDGDRAGQQAAWRGLENALPLLQDGRQLNFLFLPEGEDPDSMVRQIGQEAFLKLTESAQPLSEFLLENLQKQSDITTLEGRAKLANDSKAHLSKLPNGMLKTLLLEQINKITNIDTQTLNKNINQSAQQNNHSSSKNSPNKHYSARRNNNSRQAPLSKTRQAMALLLQHPELAKIAGDMQTLQLSNNVGLVLFTQIVDVIRSNTDAHNSLNTASLIERFRDNEHFNSLITLSTKELYEDDNEKRQDLFVALIKQINAEQTEAQGAQNIATLLAKDPSTLTDDEKQLILQQLSSWHG